MDSLGMPAAVVLRVCCSARCHLTALSSIALFLLFLTTSATNFLAQPWTSITSQATLAQYPNSTTLLVRHELRSLSGPPMVFSCLEVRSNATPPLPTAFQPCQKNSSATPLDGAAIAGIDELHLKRTTLTLVLMSLGLVVVGIAAVLCFQFHACRLDDSGRPFPGTRLCLRSPRQVVIALILGVTCTLGCGFLQHHSTRFYAAEVTEKWQRALPREVYTVDLGTGVTGLARVSTYAWGAAVALLVASCFGPLKWHSDVTPFDDPQPQPAGRQRNAAAAAAAAAAASPRSAAFHLRELVTLPVEAVQPCVTEGPGKTEFGWPLHVAVYAPPLPPPAPQEGGLFSFTTPLRRAPLP